MTRRLLHDGAVPGARRHPGTTRETFQAVGGWPPQRPDRARGMSVWGGDRLGGLASRSDPPLHRAARGRPGGVGDRSRARGSGVAASAIGCALVRAAVEHVRIEMARDSADRWIGVHAGRPPSDEMLRRAHRRVAEPTHAEGACPGVSADRPARPGERAPAHARPAQSPPAARARRMSSFSWPPGSRTCPHRSRRAESRLPTGSSRPAAARSTTRATTTRCPRACGGAAQRWISMPLTSLREASQTGTATR